METSTLINQILIFEEQLPYVMYVQYEFLYFILTKPKLTVCSTQETYIKDIVQPIEGYHPNRFDFLHHRRYFLDTRKGLISRR